MNCHECLTGGYLPVVCQVTHCDKCHRGACGRRSGNLRCETGRGEMAARQQVLDKTDLFGTLPPELLGQLRNRTELARLRRGDVIFEKGDPATNLYVVFSGRVAIAAKAADGRESVISVLGPGALFGEMSMFDGGMRSAHARALTTVHLIAVSFDDVREVLVDRP